MSNTGDYRSKVQLVMEKYDIALDLVSLWTGNRGERLSLRELARKLNKQILETVLESKGVMATQRDIEHIYEALAGEQTKAEAVQKRRDLERQGVDVDELESDFVTHQSVHSYLTEVEGETYSSRDPEEQLTDAVESINRLENRTKAVSESVIERFAKIDAVTVGDTEVYVEARVYCSDCGAEMRVTELLEGGGCGCAE
ncbi:MAG: hypothetical protein U5K70_00855 [Halodesulfurarchaeum sp.]|nr:hypothetical protein [Halodesulfurarchaeum sp.]